MFKPQLLLNQIRLSHVASKAVNKVTLPILTQMARNKQPISVLTAHDFFSGKLANDNGIDIVLTGDSLAMVAMGFDSTSSIDLQDMVYHCRAVSRGLDRSFLVADLPFGSYERGPDQALESAIMMIKRGKAECVKFEGGRELCPTVEKLSSYGICVMPHIGLTPQRELVTGGFKVQGRTARDALKIIDDAIALERAGAHMLLLEGVPNKVGQELTESVSIPVIGIGAGAYTSGQVLVQLDMLGGFDKFVPKFVRKYADLQSYCSRAISQYNAEVKNRQFPEKEHMYMMNGDEYAKLQQALNERKCK